MQTRSRIVLLLRVGVVVLVIGLGLLQARHAFVTQWEPVTATVVRPLSPDVIEVEAVDSAGDVRIVTVRRSLDDSAESTIPGREVDLLLSRVDPDTAILGGVPYGGFDPFWLGIALFLAVATTLVVVAPNFILVRDEAGMREDRGFYWRS